MSWVVFSYTVPAKSRSSFRVSVWRRLGRLGALSTTSGVYILPARDDCLEALQWLAQETRKAGGEALVMRVDQFEGIADSQWIERFNQARAREYQLLDAKAAALEKSAGVKRRQARPTKLQEALTKLRRRYQEIVRVDYFSSPAAGPVGMRLDSIEQALAPGQPRRVSAEAANIADYQNKRWITRPRPHVDRLACIWLIRRFIDSHAVIHYANSVEPREIAFDMPNAKFGHEGNRCTFETMLHAFALDEPALLPIAQIVHEIDLRDGQYVQPATPGIDQVLNGWLLANYSDAEREAHGNALFEGLYLSLSTGPASKPTRPQPKRKRNNR